jgi:MFS family permease
MQMTLLSWLVLEMSNSPWQVALVGFFSTVPMLVLGLLGGILADRVPRQRLLLITQGINGSAGLVLTLLLCSGLVQVWHAYVIVLINGICWSLDFPSRRALIYDLLGTSGVTNAMALDAIGMNGSRMVGPALAGVLIATVGVTGGYALITGFYLIALSLLGSLRLASLPQPAHRQQSMGRNLLAGFGYVRQHPVILATIGITVVMNLLLFPYTQMIPVVARDVLHVDPVLMGALQAAEGLGALVGALLIASMLRLSHQGRLFLGGSLLGLLALCGFSLSHWYILSFPLLVCLGLGTAAFGTMQSTLVMLTAHEEMRGRALGVLSLAIGAGPLGSLFLGAMASAVHPLFAMRINALIGLVALALLALCLPTIMDRIQPALASSEPTALPVRDNASPATRPPTPASSPA